MLARTWRESKGYEHKYLQMDPEVGGDAAEPQASELSDMDVLDDGEDRETRRTIPSSTDLSLAVASAQNLQISQNHANIID